MSHEPLLRDLYQAISGGVTGDGLARFFSPDAEQVEYPSAIRPAGSRRPLADMLAASEQGAGLLSAQSYDVVSMGNVPAGSELVAHVGAFYAFASDGRIARQSSYDCYEPFPA